MSDLSILRVNGEEYEVPHLFKAWIVENTSNESPPELWNILEDILSQLEHVKSEMRWFYIGFYMATDTKKGNFQTVLRILDFIVSGMASEEEEN